MYCCSCKNFKNYFYRGGGGGVPTTTRVKMVRGLHYHQVLLELTKSFPLDAAPHVPIFVFSVDSKLRCCRCVSGMRNECCLAPFCVLCCTRVHVMVLWRREENKTSKELAKIDKQRLFRVVRQSVPNHFIVRDGWMADGERRHQRTTMPSRVYVHM